jgi:hypothetical protein
MQGALTKAGLNTALTGTPEADSVHDYLERASGEPLSKTITLNANNTTANVNVFQLTGSVEIFKIWGKIATKTTLANCTDVHFDLYDSTAAVALTKSTTGVLSAMAVGTIFVKNAPAATVITVADNVAGALTEPAANKAFYPFIVTQKTGANTYIRFNYTTTDAPANATATIYVEYRPMGVGTLVAV